MSSAPSLYTRLELGAVMGMGVLDDLGTTFIKQVDEKWRAVGNAPKINIAFYASGGAQSEIFLVEKLIEKGYTVNNVHLIDIIYRDLKSTTVSLIEGIKPRLKEKGVELHLHENYESYVNSLGDTPIHLVIGIHYLDPMLGTMIMLEKIPNDIRTEKKLLDFYKRMMTKGGASHIFLYISKKVDQFIFSDQTILPEKKIITEEVNKLDDFHSSRLRKYNDFFQKYKDELKNEETEMRLTLWEKIIEKDTIDEKINTLRQKINETEGKLEKNKSEMAVLSNMQKTLNQELETEDELKKKEIQNELKKKEIDMIVLNHVQDTLNKILKKDISELNDLQAKSQALNDEITDLKGKISEGIKSPKSEIKPPTSTGGTIMTTRNINTKNIYKHNKMKFIKLRER
jgi:hypothetical protein